MIRKFLFDGIPSFFYQYDTETPFVRCTMCETSLVLANTYIIEKVFKQNKYLKVSEIVYEYAICLECAGAAGDEISQDSRQAITNVFNAHRDHLTMKLDYLHSTEKYNLESWLERCSFTGKEIRLCNEYAVSCIVENGNMVFEQGPMVVSDEFMEKLQGVLSAETKRAFDKIRDKVFDGSPSIEDIIFSPTPGLI